MPAGGIPSPFSLLRVIDDDMASEPRPPSEKKLLARGVRETNVYDDGFLRIEHANYYVACGGRRVSLPLKEFLILSRLARIPERVVTSEQIWRYAWGETSFNSLSLRVHIHRLRRTFRQFGIRIESMVGVGYCLSTDNSSRAEVE